MVVAPTQKVVKQPDSQGAGSRPHFLDADCFKNGAGKVDGSEGWGREKTDRGQGKEALMQSFSNRFRYESEL